MKWSPLSLVPIWHYIHLLQYYWLYFLCCTSHPHYFVIANRYFLILPPFSPRPPSPLPSATITASFAKEKAKEVNIFLGDRFKGQENLASESEEKVIFHPSIFVLSFHFAKVLSDATLVAWVEVSNFLQENSGSNFEFSACFKGKLWKLLCLYLLSSAPKKWRNLSYSFFLLNFFSI